jgi:hypothetical protein
LTNLSEDRKRFYLVTSQLDPRKKILSFCDNKHFLASWKDDALRFLSMDFKIFYIQSAEGGVNDKDGAFRHRINLDELLGISTTSMDFEPSSLEAQLKAYMQVQQVSNDTDPLRWW